MCTVSTLSNVMPPSVETTPPQDRESSRRLLMVMTMMTHTPLHSALSTTALQHARKTGQLRRCDRKSACQRFARGGSTLKRFENAHTANTHTPMGHSKHCTALDTSWQMLKVARSHAKLDCLSVHNFGWMFGWSNSISACRTRQPTRT